MSGISLVVAGVAFSAVITTAAGGQLTLSGTVVNSATGVPVRYAQLTLLPQGGLIQADAAGAFEFSRLEPGSYTLLAGKQGFIPFGDEESGVSITLTESRDKFLVHLTPFSTIRGRILDDSGDPVALATVVALRSAVEDGQRRNQVVGLVQTNDRGEYRIANLRPGDYLIHVSPEASHAGYYGQGPARASTVETFAPVFFGGASDAAHANPLAVKPGAEARADFHVTLRPGHALHGRIDGFRPHTRADIQLAPPDGGLGLSMHSLEYAGGRFEILGVLDGSYVLRVYQNGEGDQVLFGEQSLNVARQDLDGISVALHPAPTLTGTVRQEGVAAEAPQLSVFLQARNDLLALADQLGFRQADEVEDGKFQIANVVPGRYSIHFQSGDGQYVAAARSGQVDLLSTGELTVNAGAPPEIEVVLRSDGGSVTGTTLSKTPHPTLPLVALVPESCNRPAEVTAIVEGAFQLPDVPPGRYRLHVWRSPVAVEYGSPSVLCTLARGGLLVEVAPGRTTTVHLPSFSEESK